MSAPAVDAVHALNAMIGGLGSEFANDTAEHAISGGDAFCMIVVVAAATFSAIVDATRTGNTMTGVAFPANHVIFGRITSFTLASGSVVAYKV